MKLLFFTFSLIFCERLSAQYNTKSLDSTNIYYDAILKAFDTTAGRKEKENYVYIKWSRELYSVEKLLPGKFRLLGDDELRKLTKKKGKLEVYEMLGLHVNERNEFELTFMHYNSFFEKGKLTLSFDTWTIITYEYSCTNNFLVYKLKRKSGV